MKQSQTLIINKSLLKVIHRIYFPATFVMISILKRNYYDF